jgi:hypothetical protein
MEYRLYVAISLESCAPHTASDWTICGDGNHLSELKDVGKERTRLTGLPTQVVNLRTGKIEWPPQPNHHNLPELET